ncbi:MAG: DUF2339 domain-containing protein, partial [Planctomycetes bacterium]|nr:DUF2339 domain-containing protein [Planctomycetota bacterium]
AESRGRMRGMGGEGQVADLFVWHCQAAASGTVGALAFAAAARRWPDPVLRIVAAVPAVVAAGHLIAGWQARPVTAVAPLAFANLWYGSALGLAAVLFLLARHSASLVGRWCGRAGGYVLLVATHLEIGAWYFAGPSSESVRRIAWYTMLWSVGAGGFLAAAARYRQKGMVTEAVRSLAVALICAGWYYTVRHTTPFTLFLNVRFLSSLVMLAMVLVVSRAATLDSRREVGYTGMSARFRRALYIAAAAIGLALLTLESYYWCLARFGQNDNGYRFAQMSVSIVWGVYSLSLLVAGFSTRVRGWRLGGLGLFGVTCLKLVVVDLASLHQLHRILAFMAVGLLLMGSSYLYHRMEKRLDHQTDG